MLTEEAKDSLREVAHLLEKTAADLGVAANKALIPFRQSIKETAREIEAIEVSILRILANDHEGI